MRIFVSSVRRGLEDERDALPGLISAIGHTPVRFEDFSAQPLPSREACLAGVASADAYLLILGPNYGHRFPDTGQSPTHDEWIAAQSAGIPRVVYRKEGVTFEPEQEAFVRSIGDYTTGVFYDTFTTTAELLTKVAGKVRELHEAGDPLTFSPLTAPVTVTWRTDFEPQERHGYVSTPTSLEIHVVPVSAPIRPARIMGDLASALPARLRESGLVDANEPLNTSRHRSIPPEPVTGLCTSRTGSGSPAGGNQRGQRDEGGHPAQAERDVNLPTQGEQLPSSSSIRLACNSTNATRSSYDGRCGCIPKILPASHPHVTCDTLMTQGQQQHRAGQSCEGPNQ